MLVSWVLSIPIVTNKILSLNLGFPILPYQYIIFISPPLFYVMLRIVFRKGVQAPLLFTVLFLIIMFVVIEFYNTTPNKIANYENVKLLFLFYIFYFLIINISDNYFLSHKYTILYSVYCILFLAFTVHLGYLGFFKVIEFSTLNNIISSSALSHRHGAGGVIHPNGLSLICSIGITLILFYRKQYFNNLNDYLLLILILMMFGIIILNASRGALIISLVVLTLYYAKLFNDYGLVGKSISIFAILSLFIFILNSEQINKLYITYRLFEETSFQEARLQQIYNSYSNFIKNPLTGVGWDYTARLTRNDYISSNFFYTQLPASSGFIIFFIWFYYQVKMFYKRNCHYSPIGLVFGFLPLAFYNQSLTMPTVFIACILYFESKVSTYRKNKPKHFGFI